MKKYESIALFLSACLLVTVTLVNSETNEAYADTYPPIFNSPPSEPIVIKSLSRKDVYPIDEYAEVVSPVEQSVIDQYNKSCAMCHDTGVAGAPKTGDAAQWAPRLEKGMDALVASVDKGMNAMPPKGMCFDCSDDDFKALIEYMVTETTL